MNVSSFFSNHKTLSGTLGTLVGATTLAGVAYFWHQSKYNNKLPTTIQDNLKNVYDRSEASRIEASLQTFKDPKRIDINKLDKETLNSIAKDTNAAFVHFSGNCALLAHCFLYNYINQKQELAAINTYPVYEGVSSDIVEEALFGDTLIEICKSENLKDIEKEILNNYNQTGQSCFILNTSGYQVPLMGSSGHELNAVVLKDKFGNPKVQFVDCWKTSQCTPTHDQLAARYKNATFKLLTKK